MTNHYMFVAKAVSPHTVQIYVSRAEAGFLEFRQARMPLNYHITDHFTVLDTNEKSIFLFVSDNNVENPVGNLFVSDGLGYRFTHSLENIIKGGHAVDFEACESMEGTFIANRYDANHGNKGNVQNEGNLRQITEDDILLKMHEKDEHSRMSNSGTSNKKQLISSKDAGYKDTLDQYFDKIKTYVTHNKGSTWELVKAPEKDMNGNAF